MGLCCEFILQVTCEFWVCRFYNVSAYFVNWGLIFLISYSDIITKEKVLGNIKFCIIINCNRSTSLWDPTKRKCDLIASHWRTRLLQVRFQYFPGGSPVLHLQSFLDSTQCFFLWGTPDWHLKMKTINSSNSADAEEILKKINFIEILGKNIQTEYFANLGKIWCPS